MPFSKRVLIITGSSIGVFLLLLIVVIAVTYHTTGGFLSGVVQNCPANVTKCKNSDELFVVETGKCHKNGEAPEGECGNNMAILPLSNCNIQGQCECAYHRHNRTLIYHPDTAQCYFIYSQGFCPEGQWVRLRLGKGVCEENFCLTDPLSDPPPPGHEELFPFGRKCYPLYTVLNEVNCKGPLRFWKGKLDPSCSEPRKITTGGVGAIPSAVCPQGSYQAINGRCTPEISVDF